MGVPVQNGGIKAESTFGTGPIRAENWSDGDEVPLEWGSIGYDFCMSFVNQGIDRFLIEASVIGCELLSYLAVSG